MSNLERVDNLKQIVKLVQPEFDKLAKIHGAVQYEREASFALQILNDNSYLMQVAIADQDSFKRAIINVAAIGLSLSPVSKLAYLVPRGKKVCLDISYRGLIQLAADVGAIKWAIAEIVCQNDKYLYRGIGREPVHEFDPFSDRGEIRGAYCLAKTHHEEFILTQMSSDEIQVIRDRSESFKAFKSKGVSTPWETDTTEMIKKTVIKRASKWWPMVNTGERLSKAIDVTNDADPIDFAASALPAPEADERMQKIESIRALLKEIDRTEDKFIEHFTRVIRRQFKTFEDLTETEMGMATTQLTQLAEAKRKKEAVHENAV